MLTLACITKSKIYLYILLSLYASRVATFVGNAINIFLKYVKNDLLRWQCLWQLKKYSVMLLIRNLIRKLGNELKKSMQMSSECSNGGSKHTRYCMILTPSRMRYRGMYYNMRYDLSCRHIWLSTFPLGDQKIYRTYRQHIVTAHFFELTDIEGRGFFLSLSIFSLVLMSLWCFTQKNLQINGCNFELRYIRLLKASKTHI